MVSIVLCASCVECPPPPGHELRGGDCSTARRVTAETCPAPAIEACVPGLGDASFCSSHEDCGNGACVRHSDGCHCRARTCTSDEDCGAGFACACAGTVDLLPYNQCVRADCRASSDCDSGECILALSEDSACCDEGLHRFICATERDSCTESSQCPINQTCGTSSDGAPLRCSEFYCLCADVP